MNFKDILDGYINQLDCTMKELAEESTLSPSALSRYRMGKRVPAKNSEQLTKLASGLAILAQRKGLTSLTYDAILESFRSSFKSDFNANDFAAKFDYILNELNINVSGMAKVMNYDASFLSRIRSGERLPSNIDTFVHVFSEYVVKHNDTENVSDMLNHLLHKDFTLHNSEKELIETIYNWFLTGSYKPVNHATGFLQKVDEFNLDDYIRAIHFDNLKVPTMPFRLPTSKFYYGIEGQQKSELDFFKGTVLSKSPEPVFMCSDTDMTDMAKDSDFPKKWMFGLAMILKKGLDIHIIHNLNRPFYELMLGLEAWIPLYMTGQITPFYLKGIHNNVFQHLLYVSGYTALSGECIKGYHHQSRFYLTNGKEDMPYYKNRALALEKKALPLMDIYTQEQINRFTEFLQSNAYSSGKYHYISSSLPLFTLSNDFLLEILQKNNVAKEDMSMLLSFVETQKNNIEHLLKQGVLLQEIPELSKEEFDIHPLTLTFTDCFYSRPIQYRYNDYKKHFRLTKEFAKTHANYRLQCCAKSAFHNIQIQICEGKWAWISKANHPAIHFIIYQPQLRQAIEQMYIPIWD